MKAPGRKGQGRGGPTPAIPPALTNPTFAAALEALGCRSFPSVYDVAIETTRDA